MPYRRNTPNSFDGLLTWPAAYERVLASLDGEIYRSVSWGKSDGYWNDVPGRSGPVALVAD